MSSQAALTTWLDILDATQLAIAPLADTIRQAAFDSTVTPNTSSDTAYAVAPWNSGEIAGGGYTAGGATLGSKSLTIVSGRVVFDCADYTTANVTGSIRYFLDWDDTVSDRILAWHDLGAAITLAAETLSVTISADGLIRFR